jgi:hypothetical protein
MSALPLTALRALPGAGRTERREGALVVGPASRALESAIDALVAMNAVVTYVGVAGRAGALFSEFLRGAALPVRRLCRLSQCVRSCLDSRPRELAKDGVQPVPVGDVNGWVLTGMPQRERIGG